MPQDRPNYQPEQEQQESGIENQESAKQAPETPAPIPEKTQEPITKPETADTQRPETAGEEGIPRGSQPSDQQTASSQQQTAKQTAQPQQTAQHPPKTEEEVKNDIQEQVKREIRIDTAKEEEDAEGIQRHSNDNILNQP